MTTTAMESYEVYSKDVNYVVRARSRRHAFASLFLRVKRGEIEKKEVGQLVMVKGPDDDDEVPFRTVPTLLNMELIDDETALYNVAHVIYSVDPGELTDDQVDELTKIINGAREQDSWIVDVIKELESLLCPLCGKVVASDPKAPQAKGLLSIHMKAKHPDHWRGSLEDTLMELKDLIMMGADA